MFPPFLERNIKVDFPLPSQNSTPPTNGRPSYPPPPPPPQPIIVETPLRASNHDQSSSCSTSLTVQSVHKSNLPSPSPLPSAPLLLPPHETQPTQILSYEDVRQATGDFDDVPFTDGGHKLGQGGFGVVYHGQMNLGEGNREVAVKVFVDNVSFLKIDFCSVFAWGAKRNFQNYPRGTRAFIY